MTRSAIYARYSSDLQSATSIDDQVRLCRERAERDGMTVSDVFTDYAISGGSLSNRPGMLSLLEAAKRRDFGVVIAEALDRISRDQEDIAAIYKRLSHADVRIFTLSEGEINELHVGLKGTMNALFLKDLAIKTRRGLEGRVRQGFSGGGIAYGYDVVREIDARGEPLRGKRRINETEAAIVRRIFEEFAAGRSPKIIAHTLNHEHVPAPAGKAWGPSTIYGNWRRGTGVLNNELYIGRLVWNRQRFIKDPNTGKRQARMNPKSEWVVEEVPHLRIIDDDLWKRIKQRQDKTRSRIIKGPGNIRSEKARRPRYLLSGLIKCGACGGGFSMNGANRYACSTARNKDTCSNRLSIRRDEIEARVLDGLRKELMHPDLVKAFIDEFHREVNRLAADRDFDRDRLVCDLEKTNRDLKRIVQAIKDGIPALTLKDELMGLEERKLELEQTVSKAPAPIPRLHPRLADLYHRKVDNLHDALNQEDTRAEASEAVRALIDEIRLVPEDGELKIELFGELAALVGIANKDPRPDDRGLQVTLVAGVGFEPTTFRL